MEQIVDWVVPPGKRVSEEVIEKVSFYFGPVYTIFLSVSMDFVLQFQIYIGKKIEISKLIFNYQISP